MIPREEPRGAWGLSPWSTCGGWRGPSHTQLEHPRIHGTRLEAPAIDQRFHEEDVLEATHRRGTESARSWLRAPRQVALASSCLPFVPLSPPLKLRRR